jgi:hypothetical protein
MILALEIVELVHLVQVVTVLLYLYVQSIHIRQRTWNREPMQEAGQRTPPFAYLPCWLDVDKRSMFRDVLWLVRCIS